MPPHQQKTTSNPYDIIKLTDMMYKAYWLDRMLDSIPLNIATNTQGGSFVKPNMYHTKLPQIRQKVESFAEDIQSLPFEIPLFDDDRFCSSSAIIHTMNRGVYNVAALCYNKAVLTIYKEIGHHYSEDIAVSVVSEVSLMYETLIYQNEL